MSGQAPQRSSQAPDGLDKHPEGFDNTPEVAGSRDSGVRQHSCVDYYPEACLGCGGRLFLNTRNLWGLV